MEQVTRTLIHLLIYLNRNLKGWTEIMLVLKTRRPREPRSNVCTEYGTRLIEGVRGPRVNVCDGFSHRYPGKRALTPKDSAFVVRQTLKVAAKCHLLGLTHRDMIPVVGRNLCLQNSTSRPAHVLIRETQVLMRAKLIGLDRLHAQNHRPLPPQSNQETYLAA
ncbi:hypothetical protein Bca4012_028213 [Brassica carinata]